MVTQAVTVGMVLYGDFSAVLAVDMLLYCLSLLLEIASILQLRYTEPDMPRALRIPFDGFLLALFFLPSVAVCIFIFAAGKPEDWVITGCFVVAGLFLTLLNESSKRRYPEMYKGEPDDWILNRKCGT